jgi:hypothetical protein
MLRTIPELDRATLKAALQTVAKTLADPENVNYPTVGELYRLLDDAKSQNVVHPAPKAIHDVYILTLKWLPEICGLTRANINSGVGQYERMTLIARIKAAVK